ncbi:MAG TPA: hypothetical protein VK661_11105, partial [Planctomycetota bacterium]|nr:hypothetical protein [Planctomycetota bacterium]
MEYLPVLILLFLAVLVFLLPLVLAIAAFSRTAGLRRRVEDLERFEAGRSARVLELKRRLDELDSGIKPAVEAPPLKPVPLPPAPEPSRPASRVAPPPVPVLVSTPPPPPPVKDRPEPVPLENLIGERILPRLGV